MNAEANGLIFTRKKFKKANVKSKILLYELELKEIFERYKVSPSRERSREVFRILGDIIPELGPFSGIVEVIRDELYRSVYSQDLTTKGEQPFVERIPFFKAVSRLQNLKKEETLKLKTSKEELDQKLKFRDQDLQIAYKKTLSLKQNLFEKEAKISELANRLAIFEQDSAAKDSQVRTVRAEYIQKEQDLENQVVTLTDALTQANSIIEKLSVFKTTFSDADTSEEEVVTSSRNDKDLQIEPRGLLEYDIIEAEKLNSQFAELIDCQLDDYELSLSQLTRKMEILSLVATQDQSSTEAAHRRELEGVQRSFRNRINEINEERRLLQNHLVELKNSLEQYDLNEDASNIRRMGNDGLRRYCTRMMISTDKGSTFKSLKNAPLCVKCAEKTVICPHRLEANVFAVPERATHFKFDQISHKFKSSQVKYEEEKQKFEETEHDNVKIGETIEKIWNVYYEEKKNIKPKLTRIFILPKIIGFVSEVYEERLAFEEILTEESCWKHARILRISDFYYDFMERKYQFKETSMKPIYDMVTSIAINYETNLRCKIFAKTIAGEDDCSWKYVMLAEQLLQTYDVLDMKAYRSFLQTLYPCRTKEIYEQMELEFVAYSRNKLTPQLVEDHLMHMLCTNIEPNVLFFLRVLQKTDVNQVGSMSYEDFDEVICHILPGASMDTKKSRFLITSADFPDDINPSLERLALLATFLSLQCAFENNWLPQTLITQETLELCKQDDMVENGDAEEQMLQKDILTVLDEKAMTFNQADIDEETENMNTRVDIMIRKDELVSEEMDKKDEEEVQEDDLGDIEVNDD